jgi:hypothetical protein
MRAQQASVVVLPWGVFDWMSTSCAAYGETGRSPRASGNLALPA